LVIFFVPDPAKGVAEMARVVRPGGTVTAYAWDIPGGGLPHESLREEMRALGVVIPMPPNPDASRIDAMHELWTKAGLESIETRKISVQRHFTDFDDYWETVTGWSNFAALLQSMSADDNLRLKERMRKHLPAAADGSVSCWGIANAIKGIVSSL
jgi:SAM-dependent methyltransferase